MTDKNKLYAEVQEWLKAKQSPDTWQDTPAPCLPISFIQISQGSKGTGFSEQKTLGKGG